MSIINLDFPPHLFPFNCIITSKLKPLNRGKGKKVTSLGSLLGPPGKEMHDPTGPEMTANRYMY